MKLYPYLLNWHLGKMIYGRSLLEDQEYFIKQVFLPAVDREQPDFVILAGGYL